MEIVMTPGNIKRSQRALETDAIRIAKVQSLLNEQINKLDGEVR
jgi:hypothetical protein